MANTLMGRYGLVRPKHILRIAKNKIIDMLQGKQEEGYQYLAKYTVMVKETNPGSLCYIKWQDPAKEGGHPVFFRMFICFEACKRGFVAGCRKLLGVDGCHLKGPYKGILLTALGLDGNNHSFPIAYAIVDQESKDNWCYFLNSLRGVIGDDLDGEYTFIADRCKVSP